MSRPRVEVAVPALALRRAEAAAALGVSLETFDVHIRPHVGAVQVGGVITYPVAELRRFLTDRAISGDYDETNNPKWRRAVGAAGAVAQSEVTR